MTCASCQGKLSAYLDGELGDRDASALRGHLRTCSACAAAADSEAKLIDGLRQLPAMDPPPAMWQAIRTQLAHEEIADAEAPRSTQLWRKVMPLVRPWFRPAFGGLAVASAAVALLWWAKTPAHAPIAAGDVVRAPAPEISVTPSQPEVAHAPSLRGDPPGTPATVTDVSVALADEVSMIDRSYRDAVSELVEMVGESRGEWAPAFARKHDEKVRELRARVDSEAVGTKAKERAWQELMRYLQTSLTRAELAMGAR